MTCCHWSHHPPSVQSVEHSSLAVSRINSRLSDIYIYGIETSKQGEHYISSLLVSSEDFVDMFRDGGHLYFICHLYLSLNEDVRGSRLVGGAELCILQRMAFLTEKCQVRLFLLNYSFGNPLRPALFALSFSIFLTPRVPSVPSSLRDESIGFLARSK